MMVMSPQGLSTPTLTFLLQMLLPTVAGGRPCFVDSALCIKKDIMHSEHHGDTTNPLAISKDKRLKAVPSQKADRILGKEGTAVPVFVLMYSKSPTIICMTQKLLMQRVVPRTCSWHGPNGAMKQDSSRLFLNDNLSLMFYNVHGSDSGNYSCTVSYVLRNKEVTSEMHFIVYVYHVPGKSIQLSFHFLTHTCEHNHVTLCERQLVQNLDDSVHDLRCEIQQWKAQCTTTPTLTGRLGYRFSFQFVVFPFEIGYADICENTDCEMSIKEAYARIKQFLGCQALGAHRSISMHYITRSLTGMKVNHCMPGFGKCMPNNHLCLGCCIACPPGKYSSEYGTKCIACSSGTYNAYYGQTACTICPQRESSSRNGARSANECHSTLHMWVILLSAFLGTSFLIWVSWLVARTCFRRKLAARYIEESETGVKNMLQKLANVANAASINKQRSKLTHPYTKTVAKTSSKFRSGFSDKETSVLLNNYKKSRAKRSSTTPEMSSQSESEMTFDERTSHNTSEES